MRPRTLGGAVPAALALAFGLAACGGAANESGGDGGDSGGGQSLSGNVQGAGSSAQAAAMEAWIASFQEQHPDATLNYNPVGSGGGRERFIQGATVFGGSDAALSQQELPKATKRCNGNLIEFPAYISPIAIPYKLQGVDNLQLSPKTLAMIFNQKITKWNAPAIAKDNPNAQLPNTKITPVNRSDDSGTTENFVDYLSQAGGNAWPYQVSGKWPVSGGEAAQGTSGVVSAVQEGSGTIGYADASQTGDLSVAKVKVGQEFVGPSAAAAAKILEASEQTDAPGTYVFAYDLARDTAQSGTYPIVLTTYEMMCGNYGNGKQQQAQIVQAFYNYVISDEGQRAAQKAAGSAPLSDKLQQKFQPAVESVSAGGS